jgi:GTP1/Obg family GTP-binding protein
VEVAGKITILIEKLATEKIPSAEEISQVEEARRDAVKRMAEYAERINNAGNTPQG